MIDDSSIVAAEGWMCPLPLRLPLRLGAIRYDTRDYVVLRLQSADGLIGWAAGYTRGTPLLAAAEAMTRALGIAPADDPRAVHDSLAARFAPGWAALVRAASLIDIALWDLAAKRRKVPLAEALGGTTRPIPVMAVAGYFADERPMEELLDEVRRFIDDGYTTLKVIAPCVDAAADRTLLERIREQTPDSVRVAVDLHGSFTSVEAALTHCAELDDLPLLFVEDAFPSHEVRRIRDFAAGSVLPVAAGEDVVGTSTLIDLLDGGVGYLRVDATASGGYTDAVPAIVAAEERDRLIAPHVWPHTHAPLAGLSEAVIAVEVTPPYVGADPLWDLMTEGPPLEDGRWQPSQAPGLDLPIAPDAVARAASARWAWRTG
jgi:D-arabinonate dehydratase